MGTYKGWEHTDQQLPQVLAGWRELPKGSKFEQTHEGLGGAGKERERSISRERTNSKGTAGSKTEGPQR